MARADEAELEAARAVAALTLKRVLEDRRAREVRAVRARTMASRLAARLAAEPGVRRVVLFGSLAGAGGLVHSRSDIDLAVEGLDPGAEDRLGVVLEDLAGMSVDLVRLEDAAPRLRQRIVEDGEVLFVAE